MAHVRAQIRQGIAQVLTGLNKTGSRVYPSRMFSLDESDLPSISVYTTDEASPEEITKVTLGTPSRLHRNLPLIIEGHAIVDEKIDDELDQIALEIEVAMGAPFSIDSHALAVRLVSTQMIISGDGDAQVGVVRLLYSISYSTLETSPDSL